jgi:hypothetical protein
VELLRNNIKSNKIDNSNNNNDNNSNGNSILKIPQAKALASPIISSSTPNKSNNTPQSLLKKVLSNDKNIGNSSISSHKKNVVNSPWESFTSSRILSVRHIALMHKRFETEDKSFKFFKPIKFIKNAKPGSSSKLVRMQIEECLFGSMESSYKIQSSAPFMDQLKSFCPKLNTGEYILLKKEGQKFNDQWLVPTVWSTLNPPTSLKELIDAKIERTIDLGTKM